MQIKLIVVVMKRRSQFFWSASQMTALTHSHLRQTLEKQRQSLSYSDDVEFEPEQRPLNVTLLKDSDEEEMEETVGRTAPCEWFRLYMFERWTGPIRRTWSDGNVSVKSKLQHAPPSTPGIPRAFDTFAVPGRREFDHQSLLGGGEFDPHALGVGNLSSTLDFM